MGLLGFLDSRGVSYAAVGDLTRLEGEDGGDLDLVVDSLHGITDLLHDFCRKCDARIVQVLQHEQTAFYYVLARASECGDVCLLQADVCSDYFRRGRRLLQAEQILSGRIRVGGEEGAGIYVPRPAMNFAYYLIKRVEKQDLNGRHQALLSRLWREDAEGARREICRYWPGADGDRLCRAAEQNDWSSVLEELPRLQRKLDEGVPRALRHWILELVRRAQRVVRPTGVTVAFFGPDGAGKSSVAEGVVRTLAPAFRRTKMHHLRPGVLLRPGHARDALDPHARPARGILRSCLQLCAWWLEYTIAHLIEVLPATIRSTLVVFDRHAIDVLVDPKRYRYGGPPWLARWMARSVPAPDLLILLDADAELLRHRKPELSSSEVVRQRGAYLQLVTSLRGGYVIDAGRPLGEVVRAASDVILAHMADRTDRRREFQP